MVECLVAFTVVSFKEFVVLFRLVHYLKLLGDDI